MVAVTLRSEGNVTLSERVEGVETVTSSSDIRLEALPEDTSRSGRIWSLLNGVSSRGTLLSSCKTSLSFCRSCAAFSAVARAVSNVLWNSDVFTVSSEVTLPDVEDSSVSDNSGDPSLDVFLGTTVWGAVS